jgi:uncharacterized damage-inducible protein DinB
LNRSTLQELYDFDGWAWDQLAETVKSLPDGTFARPAPGSGWPAIRNCMGHIAFGYSAWMSRLEGGELDTIDFDQADWAAMDGFYKAVRKRFRAYFDSLTDDELTSDRDVPTHGGEVRRYTPGEVLAHILSHGRAHHGDLFTLFHQLGLDLSMPLIDYRYYIDAKR